MVRTKTNTAPLTRDFRKLERPRANEIDTFIQHSIDTLAHKTDWGFVGTRDTPSRRWDALDPIIRRQIDILRAVQEFSRFGKHSECLSKIDEVNNNGQDRGQDS